MSNVDKRVVEMQFDNKQFESNIQTSVKSSSQKRDVLFRWTESATALRRSAAALRQWASLASRRFRKLRVPQ